MNLRLCLVRVKAFSENIPFSGNAIFWKGKCFHVFGCISKKFPKNIFWCLEKNKEKTNPEKHGQNPEKKKSSTIDARLASSTRGEIAIDARLGSTARCFAIDGAIGASRSTARSWSREIEIAIDGTISRRSRSRHWSRSWIAIDGTVVELELAKHHAVEPSRASIVDDFFSGLWLVFF